jgi:hypothetical protein
MSDDSDETGRAVDALAALLGLKVDPAHRAATIENFGRIEAIARLVMEFPLPADVEPAPIFSHDD